ncbi:MAG: hypothetical protein PHC53_04790 [Patescibacteria group bacterium]|nr:hypothetical protein [Patescibacteria group bacterium]
MEETMNDLRDQVFSFFKCAAEMALAHGCDEIVVEPMGNVTYVTSLRRISSGADPEPEVLDMAFGDIEMLVIEALSLFFVEARPYSKCIRAFGKQHTRLDEICDAPHQPRRAPMLGLPKEFQPQGVHREGFNAPKEQPKQYRTRCPIY